MKKYIQTFLEKDRKLNTIEPSFENLFRFPYGLIAFPIIILIVRFYRFELTSDIELNCLIFTAVFGSFVVYFMCFCVKTLKTMILTREAL